MRGYFIIGRQEAGDYMLWFCRSEMINCGAVKHFTAEMNVGYIAHKFNYIFYFIFKTYFKHVSYH